jgi:hypothetical protein
VRLIEHEYPGLFQNADLRAGHITGMSRELRRRGCGWVFERRHLYDPDRLLRYRLFPRGGLRLLPRFGLLVQRHRGMFRKIPRPFFRRRSSQTRKREFATAPVAFARRSP